MINTFDHAAPVAEHSRYVATKLNRQQPSARQASPEDDVATRLYKLLAVARQAEDEELRQSASASNRERYEGQHAPVMEHSHDFAWGIVSQTDEAGVVRSHSWGQLDDEYFDESSYPDGYLIRRYRSRSIFQRIPLNDREHYLVLTTRELTYTWKGTFDEYRQVSLKFVPQPHPFYASRFAHRVKDAGFRPGVNCISMRYH